MNRNDKILITGAAGFIASCMASYLNKAGYHQLILCDDFSKIEKENNFKNIQHFLKIDRNQIEIFFRTKPSIQYVIHFGARTDTTEMDYAVHQKWNVDFSKLIWDFCCENKTPLIYASSAATYGNGEFGYQDDESKISNLEPLNPYGVSKNEFDKWVLSQIQENHTPPFWYGLKFFNVYGPNEYHKQRMASVIFHAFHQIQTTGQITLFRSHHPNYKDGEQKRDFIYVKDILKVTLWLMQHLPANGIYNLGSGKANTFLSLAHAIFDSLNKPIKINFIDTPQDIRDKYQYFTEANMDKLKSAGYSDDFYTIESGVKDYVKNYLLEQNYY